jgi:hypothetical protein
MKLLHIDSATSAAFHPQTDGQTERMNQVVEDYLCHFVNYNQNNWADNLDLAKFSINNLHSSSSGVSPFFFIHGYHPQFNSITTSSNNSCANHLIQDLQDIQEKATTSLQQAKIKQAHYYNQHRTVPPVYSPGDLVLLSQKNIKTHRSNSKLDFRHLGPFSVIRMVGDNAVLLDIKEHYPKLHPVFNVSLLTPYKDPATHPFCVDELRHPNNHISPTTAIDWKFLGKFLLIG